MQNTEVEQESIIIVFQQVQSHPEGARGSVVVKALALSLKVACSRHYEVNELFFNLPIPWAALGPGVHLHSNRNEYQKHITNVLEE
jgi:hypothetical protein